MRSRQRLYQRPKHFGRELRVADFIQKELADLLRNKVRDPRINASELSVPEVKVSRDLAYADVYVARFLEHPTPTDPTDETVLDVLQRAAGFFRSELAARHSMRTTPELRFHLDRTEAEARRIEELLAQVRRA
ncbi:MAG: 30S ribosome-binding factor RbfA [Gammaproteobacteria bacterium]|nr:30S ribosome-binding factor RbfA [Gammaproteobacteria bacterium]